MFILNININKIMKKFKYIIPICASLGLLSCSVEAPFKGAEPSGTGELSKFAFDFETSVINNTRAVSAQEIIDDFTVVIQKPGNPDVTVGTYTYKDMPDVITLEAGTYKISAIYGEDQDAAWESPYFLGQSDEFKIEPNKITTNIGTVDCKLENVKVTIDFHSTLYDQMGTHDYVEVYVNPDKSLKFYKDETRAGYFKLSDVCTLTATFHGVIDDVELNEVKTLDNVDKGNHYNLTFSKHIYSADSDEGEIDGQIKVGASVKIVDINNNITIADDEILDDKERPSEQDPSQGEIPGIEPDDPGTDEPTKPEITASEGLNLDEVNELIEGMPIVLNIVSSSPISSFLVHIDSSDSGFMDAIDDIIGNDFDLIQLDKNDGGKGFSLSELGFPVGTDVSNPSEVDENGNGIIKFEITKELQSLLLVYEGTHEFTLTVTNDKGTTSITLKLKVTKE